MVRLGNKPRNTLLATGVPKLSRTQTFHKNGQWAIKASGPKSRPLEKSSNLRTFLWVRPLVSSVEGAQILPYQGCSSPHLLAQDLPLSDRTLPLVPFWLWLLVDSVVTELFSWRDSSLDCSLSLVPSRLTVFPFAALTKLTLLLSPLNLISPPLKSLSTSTTLISERPR